MKEIEPLPVGPMGFGSVIGNGFTLLGRTLSTTGVLSLLVVLPFSFLLSDAMSGYFGALVQMMGTLPGGPGQEPSPEVVAQLFGPMFYFGGAMILYVLAMLVVQTVTVLFAWEAAEGTPIGLAEGIARGLRKPVWMVLAQTFILGVFMALGFFAFSLVAGVLAVGATDGSGGGGSAALLSIFMILFGIGVLYFIVATIFRVHRVAIEERGPWQGLIASISLVKGNWWRVFGVLFVIYIIISIITVPFAMGLLADDLIDFRNVVTAGGSNDPAVLAEFMDVFKGLFSWKFALIQTLQGVVGSLLLSNLLTAMYIDLRARRGELVEAEEFGEDTTAW